MTTLFICKTVDSRYKRENKQIIKQDRSTNNLTGNKEYKRKKKLSRRTNLYNPMLAISDDPPF